MVVFEELPTAVPAMRNLPLKPKKNQEPPITVVNEVRVLQTKPDSTIEAMADIPDIDLDDCWFVSAEGIAFNDHALNTPTMDDYLIPTTVDVDPSQYADTPELHLQPHQPAAPPCFEETWTNLCVNPAEAEGIEEAEGSEEEVHEFVLPVSTMGSPTTNCFMETSVLEPISIVGEKPIYRLETVHMEPEPEGREKVHEVTLSVTETLQEPGLRLMSNDVDDAITMSLMESGIDLNVYMNDLMMGTGDIPAPIASTSCFIMDSSVQEPVIMVEEKPNYPLETINMVDMEAVTSCQGIKDDTVNDPTWVPENDDWNEASTSTRSSLHGVQKKPMKRKSGRKPGRPERVEPFIITEVPSRQSIDSANMTEAQINELKYRRMRDLNNKASKDCRARRRNKQQDLELEVENLTARNLELRENLQKLEKEVLYYRRINGRQ